MARAARTSRSRRRTRSRLNPTARQVATWGGAAVAAGLVGYGAYRLTRRRQPKFELPQPSDGGQGAGAPSPIGCEIGPNYPGFVQDESGACVPTSDTPPGIYVDAACADFVYVGGDGGPQLEDLDNAIFGLVALTKDPRFRSADPTHNVTMFLQKFWPNCTWPPVGSTLRLQQMFNALSLLLGREIVHRGGRVLGTGSLDEVDERVATRLTQLGMPDYDPDVVPEIELPVYEEPSPPGPDLPEPEPEEGKLDLPPGGQDLPQPPPPGPPLAYPVDFPPPPPLNYPVDLKPCQQIPYVSPRFPLALDPAPWSVAKTRDFLLFDFGVGDRAQCPVYNMRFGICLRPTSGVLYGALNPENPLPDHPLHMRNEDNAGFDWSQFTWTPLWKRQYSARIGLINGKASSDSFKAITDPGVDPCPNDTYVWPTPSVNKFIITADHGAEPRFRETDWVPRPRVTLVAQGQKIFARLHYVGMPRFMVGGADPQWGGIDVPNSLDGHLVSSVLGQTTAFEGDYKVWALGAV